jgi:replicative DNA helicase
MKKVPIRSNSEQAALSLLVQDPDILAKQHWEASLFAIKAHQTLFTAIKAFHSRNGICDEFTAISELENMGELERMGGHTAVLDILKCMNIPAGRVAQDVANDFRKELWEAKGYRDLLVQMEEMEPEIRRGQADLRKLSLTIESVSNHDHKPKRTKKEMLTQIIDEMEGKAKKETLPTGLLKLDRCLQGGMHRGEMMTVAAETGGGKSILLVQAAVSALIENRPVLFFSLEMAGEDIYRRMAANLAGVPIREMEDYKEKHGAELPKISQALMKLHSMPVEVVDHLHDISDIESEIARFSGENRTDVVAVDYLQIVSLPNSDNRENAISDAARRLKTAAMKHKIVMFTASQLNDEGRLRESRAIGMHSDQVVHIEHGKDKSRVVVKKNRRGPRNYTIDVAMRGELSKLEEVW